MFLLKVVNGQKPREIALQILQQRPNGDFVEHLLDEMLAKTSLSPADRGLCQELVYGIVRWQATLDWLIARKTNHRRQTPLLQNLLRLGLYQIFWLQRIPNHAAVNETVALARPNGLTRQAGFINAVLRTYLREFEGTRKLLAELKTTQPDVGYSHPEWLVSRWQTRWGQAKTEQLLEWNNTPPRLFARMNTLKASAAELLVRWAEEKVEFSPVHRDWFEENLVFELKSHPPLDELQSFRAGLFYIQDPSTLLAVRLLTPQPGETLLDLCAAPGGKLTYTAQLMNNRGQVFAHDTAPERVKMIKENCQRLGVTCAVFPEFEVRSSKFEVQSWPSPSLASSPLFDRILIDAPCSNTGVMRRRVDLRWRIRLDEIQRLRSGQLNLLNQAAARLRVGGVMIYSTCSLEPEENEEIVTEFLNQNVDFKLDCSRQLLPMVENVDGAYAARLLRITHHASRFPLTSP
jgi:16S rRNA (cytosine967-C5)-methyltransferase